MILEGCSQNFVALILHNLHYKAAALRRDTSTRNVVF
jgi:hypothetical protein